MSSFNNVVTSSISGEILAAIINRPALVNLVKFARIISRITRFIRLRRGADPFWRETLKAT